MQLTKSKMRKGAVLLLALMLLDVIRYHMARVRARARGAWWTLPFVGDLFSIVRDPTRFWDSLCTLAPRGVSAFKMLSRPCFFVTDPALAKQVFEDGRTWSLFVHPNSEALLGKDNLVYMPAADHVKWRKIMVPTLMKPDVLRPAARTAFSRSLVALRGIASRPPAEQRKRDLRFDLRLLNAHLSLEVFVGGGYIPSAEADQVAEDLLALTNGFLVLPIDLPFTEFGKARAASRRIQDVLQRVSRAAAERMREPGAVPVNVLDRLTLACMEQKIEGYGKRPEDIAHAGLDFCFAAQDATTSALAWALHSLEAHPSVAADLRAELLEALKGDEGCTDNDDDWLCERVPALYSDGKLPLLRAAAVNLLQYKPPVPMVPYLAKEEGHLGEHVIPKGALTFASIVGTKKNVPGTGQTFAPSKDKVSDPGFKEVLVFGAGAHQCPGRFYASNTVALFMAALVLRFQTERLQLPGGEDIIYLPTLYPRDSLYVLKEATS